MLESKRKGSACSSPQSEARHSINFVDTAMDRRFHAGGVLCSSTRSNRMAEAKLDGFSVLR